MKGLSAVTGIIACFLGPGLSNGQQSSGDPDGMFGYNGTSYYNDGEGNGPGIGQCLALQSDGKIILAGCFGAHSGYVSDMAAIRFSADGAIDPGFGTNGRFKIYLTGSSQCRAIAIRPDGRILLAGNFVLGEGRRSVVVRVLESGSLDNSFGYAGVAKPYMAGGNDNSIDAIALLPDGRILLAGTVNLNEYQRNFVVALLSGEGQQDFTFGVNGILQISFGENVISELKSMAVSSSGLVTLVGNATPFGSASTSIAMARITTDGAFDQSFGVGGSVLSPLGVGVAQAASVAEADGAVGVAGGLSEAGSSRFFVVKFRPDGTRDPTFGIDGFTSVIVRPGTDEQANGIMLQPDGSIVAAGTSAVPDSADIEFAIVRLLPNGSPDQAFGQSGRTTIAFPFNPRDYCRAIIRTPNAMIVGGSANGKFAVAKVIGYRDIDGDNFDDKYEESNGTDPRDANSYPLTAVFTPDFELRFPAARDKFHVIEVSIDLQSWTVLESNIRGFGGSLSRFYLYDVPQRFYRVRRLD